MYKYIRLVLKYFWVILISMVIIGGSQFALDKFYFKNVYEAKTTIYVLHKPSVTDPARSFDENAYQNLLASEMLVQDYKEIVKSGIVLQGVRDELKDLIPGIAVATDTELGKKITVDVKIDTRIITVTVQDNDARAAALIANKTAEVFKNRSFEIIGSNNVTILDTAQTPGIPVKPKPVADTMIAAVAGIIAGIAFILFLDYMRTQKEAAMKEAAVKDAMKVVMKDTMKDDG